MFELTYLGNVVTLQLDQGKCTGCRMCVQVCPHEVFQSDGKKVRIVRKDHCMECGACQKNCPEGAISVKAGVGCAAGVINGLLKGSQPSCDCQGSSGNCC